MKEARDILDHLLAGNQRFQAGTPESRTYTLEDLDGMARQPRSIAAVITCADSRVAPEIVFDQPLGSLFVSRSPGNTASDGAKWLVDIAVSDMRVPLVLVVGHTGCVAVGQLVAGATVGPGGQLRRDVGRAVLTARSQNPEDLMAASLRANALQTLADLREYSDALRAALREGRVATAAALYDMHSGSVEVLAGPD